MYYMILAPTFAALIPARQRLCFTLACAAVRHSKKKNKKSPVTRIEPAHKAPISQSLR